MLTFRKILFSLYMELKYFSFVNAFYYLLFLYNWITCLDFIRAFEHIVQIKWAIPLCLYLLISTKVFRFWICRVSKQLNLFYGNIYHRSAWPDWSTSPRNHYIVFGLLYILKHSLVGWGYQKSSTVQYLHTCNPRARKAEPGGSLGLIQVVNKILVCQDFIENGII